MDKRPLKVTGPKRYHLRGHHSHFPRANLEGAADQAESKVPRKQEKSAWKLAADYTAAEQQQLEQHWLEQARKQLGPQASPDEVTVAARELMQGQSGNYGAAERAAAANADYAESGTSTPFNGRMGMSGFSDPLATAAGKWTGFALPTAVQATAGKPSNALNRDGSINPAGVPNGDPVKGSVAEGSDRIADILMKRDLALQKGDTAEAQQLEDQYKAFKFQDPSARARGAAGGGLADVGSQVSDMVSAPFGAAFAARGAGIGAGVSSVWNALHAPSGHRMEAVKNSLTQAAPAAAQGTANMAALSKLLKAAPAAGAAAAAAPATIGGRLMGMGKNILKPTNLVRGGTLVGGVQGIADLGRWATGNEDFEAAREGQLRNETMAAEGRGTGASILHGAGAGARAMFTGNLDPARAIAGNAIGHLTDSTPAARQVAQAKLDLNAGKAGNEGYEQARNLLTQDPRFKNLDPHQIDDLAAQAVSHASTGSMVDQQVPGNGQPNQASTQNLVRYSGALDRYNQGKATAQDMGFLQELAGGQAANGKFSPEQLQSAGRNAMLYHRFGKETAQGLMHGAADQIPFTPAQPTPQASAQSATPYQKPDYQQVIDHLMQNPQDPQKIQQYQELVSKLPEQEKQLAANYLVEQQGNKQSGGLNRAGNWLNEKAPGLVSLLPAGMKPTGAMSNDEVNSKIQQGFEERGAATGQNMQAAAEKDFTGAQSGQPGQEGGWLNYLKNNPSLGLLPMGLIGMMGGSRIGKVLGLMALAGGAYNLYNRYQALQDPKFQQAAQARATAMAGKTWDQTREQQFQQQFGSTAQDLGAAQHAHLVDLPALARQKAQEMAKSVLPGQKPAPAATPAPAAPQAPEAPQPTPAPAQPTPAPQPGPTAKQTAAPAPVAAEPAPPVVAQAKPPIPPAQSIVNKYTPQPMKPLVPPVVPGKLS